jgi:uncharacterized protein
MVDITPVIAKGKQRITGYGAGGFSVNGQRTEGSVMVLPDSTQSCALQSPSELTLEVLVPLFSGEQPVEIVLVGTGARMVQLPAGLRAELKARGIALEAMDTGAACRTYNVLLAEERRVAAVLLAV